MRGRSFASVVAPVCAGLFVCTLGSSSAQQAVERTAQNLVGTWTLVWVERPSAESGPSTIANPRGVLILD